MDWLNRLKQTTELPPVVENKPSTEGGEDTPKSNRLGAVIVKPGAATRTIWANPYPKGTPQARIESLRVIEAARRGEPI